jgi:hypothetical protein
MVTPENKASRDDTQEQLRFAQEECERLREENARLRTMLGIPESAVGETDSASNAEVSAVDSSKSGRDLSTPEGKITLFLNLFRGERTFTLFGGRGREENQVIRPRQPWTGERSIWLGQKNASVSPARHVCCFR